MEWWEIFKTWFLSLGEKLQRKSLHFSEVSMVGAIPFLFLCLGWTIRKYKEQKALCIAGFANRILFHFGLFISYRCWQKYSSVVYAFIALLIGYGNFILL